MNQTFLGFDARRRPIHLSADVRASTHMHVIGSSGTGKSKFLEWLIRQDIRNGQGLCVVDWHGTLCTDVLKWCHQMDVGLFEDPRRVIIINPSKPDFVVGFNPFRNDGTDVSTQVSRRIDATIRPWGITNTNEMPTFERVCRALFTYMVETGETLPNAAQLLDFSQKKLRAHAAASVKDRYAASIWRELERIAASDRTWREYVLSTENRLARFLSSTSIRRFMGLQDGNIDFEDAMDTGKIVFINLGYSDCLPVDAARVFASLVLNELFETAMRRANKTREGRPRLFSLYLDEFQEYITDDIAAMLDQVRKGGLHIILAHQHLGHFVDNQRLQKSVLTNARIRAVFGGLDYTDASIFGNEMFLPDLNTRQIKKAYYHTTHLYQEETREQVSRGTSFGSSTGFSRSSGHGSSETHSESHGLGVSTGGSTSFALRDVGEVPMDELKEGWFSETAGENESSSSGMSNGESWSTSESESSSDSWGESESVTAGTVFVPIPVRELGSETEWSREEKLSKVAELLKYQQQRHCFIKLDQETTQPIRVPDVITSHVEPETLDDYVRLIHVRQGSRRTEEVDALLRANEERFSSIGSSATVGRSPSNAASDEEFFE